MDILEKLDKLLEDRKSSTAEDSYVKKLYDGGLEEILKKIKEESEELIEAASKIQEGRGHKIIHETADLWFHTMVLLSKEGVSSAKVLEELEIRFGKSGLEEKANRDK